MRNAGRGLIHFSGVMVVAGLLMGCSHRTEDTKVLIRYRGRIDVYKSSFYFRECGKALGAPLIDGSSGELRRALLICDLDAGDTGFIDFRGWVTRSAVSAQTILSYTTVSITMLAGSFSESDCDRQNNCFQFYGFDSRKRSWSAEARDDTLWYLMPGTAVPFTRLPPLPPKKSGNQCLFVWETGSDSIPRSSLRNKFDDPLEFVFEKRPFLDSVARSYHSWTVAIRFADTVLTGPAIEGNLSNGD